MSNKISQQPCPICKKLIVIIGLNNKKQKIGSCGHVWSFKKTKSSKIMDRKYVVTRFGLELKTT